MNLRNVLNSNNPILNFITVLSVLIISIAICVGLFGAFGINEKTGKFKEDSKTNRPTKYINVNIYSYQLEESQTDSIPSVGAFGDTLEMDIGIIALSRDLKKFFNKNDTIYLTLNNKKHTFVFKDIMGPRHRNSVDLLTNKNVRERGQLWLKTQTQGR